MVLVAKSVKLLRSRGFEGIIAAHGFSGIADNPVKDNPPPGKVKPVNAFGRVWGNFDFIRNALGWAVGAEQGYTMTVIYGTRQPAPDITFTLPNGSVHRQGGTWTAIAK